MKKYGDDLGDVTAELINERGEFFTTKSGNVFYCDHRSGNYFLCHRRGGMNMIQKFQSDRPYGATEFPGRFANVADAIDFLATARMEKWGGKVS